MTNALTPLPETGLACPNCSQPLGTPKPRYCSHCGQETNVLPPTLGEFAQQFGGSYLAAEGALWRTLRLLITRPGELTRQYLQGRRRHYVLPLRLYLTVSVLTLVLVQLFASVKVQPAQPDDLEKLAASQPSFTILLAGSHKVGLDKGRFFCEGLPGWVCDRFERRLNLAPKALQREMAELPARMINHWGTAMFWLVPLFAVVLKAVYFNRHRRTTEHLVFALHLHAFWFLALALASLPVPVLPGLLALAMPVYAFMAARRVYGGRWWTTLLRGVAIVAAYGLAMALTLGVVLVWAMLA
jgi:hypothetical protein